MIAVKKSIIYGIFSKIPTLETKRLILRKMNVSDWRDMYEYSKNPDVTKYLLWESHKSPEQTKNYLAYIKTRYRAGDFYDWAIVDKLSGKMIGTCGFTRLDFNNNSAEIGYVLNPNYWGYGVACEAALRVLEFAFMVLNVHRVEAQYMIENDRSLRVMQKCGMSFEGIRRSAMFVKGEYRDIGICSIIFDEYLRLRTTLSSEKMAHING